VTAPVQPDRIPGRELRGALGACGAFTAVGSLVAAASLIDDYPIAWGQATRYAIAAAALALLGWRAGVPRPTLRELIGLAALAASGLALFNVFLIAGVREGDAGTVGVIVSCVPVVLAIAAPLLERRAVSLRVLAAAAVVAAGAAAVEYTGGEFSAAGVGFALGALACEAAFSLLAVPYLARLRPVGVSVWACILATPMLLAWGIVAEGAPPTIDAGQLAALTYMALVVTVGGFLMWYSSLTLIGVERAGLFAGVLPVTALLFSVAIGAAEFTVTRLAGALVVAVGITIGVRVSTPPGPLQE
jgi:drug/metabolite transporter (DMT)-like permease